MEEKMMTSAKKKPIGILFVALAVVATVLLNFMIGMLPNGVMRADMTEQGSYTLSESTQEVLGNLGREVTVYILDADGGDLKFEYFMETLCECSDWLTLKKVSADESEELLAKVGLVPALVTDYCVVAESDKRIQIVNYASLFYYETTNSTLNSELGIYQMSASDYYSYLEAFSQNSQYSEYLSYLISDTTMYFQGEGMLSSMIEYVAAEMIPTHYVLTGHGEIEFASSMQAGIHSVLGTTYQMLDLSETKTIPADASTVLVMAPTSDFSDAEIAEMKAYLQRGGQMTFVTNEANLAMPNLMSLMAAYGMTATSGAVGEMVEITLSEEDAADAEDETEGEQTEPNLQPSYSVEVTVNTGHDSMAEAMYENLGAVITNGNAIAFAQTADSSLIHTSLLTTSDQAFIGENTEELGVRTLAAAAETADGAHLLWFTGAESYAIPMDEMTESDEGVINNYCLYITIHWSDLQYTSALTVPDATVYDSGYTAIEESDATVFGVVTVLLLPLAILAIGLVIGYKRKKA